MARILARGARIAPSHLLGRAALARQGAALVLVAPDALRPPLVLVRAQAAGVEATGFADVRYPLVRPNEVLAPLVLARAQAAGVQATGDV